MTKFFDVTDTAKIIRKRLKKQFPSTKFSVTSKRYSGGSSISISWQDGAAYTEVESEIAIFQGKSFDGSIDLATYIKVEYEGEEACFPHYINCNRSTSREFVDRVYDYCQDRLACADKLRIVGSTTDSRFDVENYYQFEDVMVKANQILNESKSDRVFDWAKEKLEIEANEKLQQEIIAEQEAKDREYLSLQEISPKYLRAIGTEVDGYEIIEARVKFRSSEIYHFVDGVLQYGIYGEFADIPKYEDRPIITVLIAEHMETGRSEEWTWLDYENIIDPIEPISITATDLRIKAKFASNNKQDNIAEYYEQCSLPAFNEEYNCSNWRIEDCRVIEQVELSPAHYDRFVISLLNGYDFLEGKGGVYSDCEDLPQDKDFYKFTKEEQELFYATSYTQCVAITAKDRETILANPEGYSYVRYLGLIEQQQAEPVLRLNEYKEKKEERQIESASTADGFPDPGDWRSASTADGFPDPGDWRSAKLDLHSYYKQWLESLISTDRLTEIVDYQTWLLNCGEKVYQQQYKQFVDRCLKEGLLNEIISFEEWKLG